MSNGFRVARATQQDIDGLNDLAATLQRLFDFEMLSEVADIEFDINSQADCRAAMKMLFAKYYSFNINRAAMNLSTLLNPVNKLFDPDSDQLEFHPEIKAMRRINKKNQQSEF